MDLGLTQSLKQEQILSPQMLQSLALLPMPILELKEHIQKEIEANPALEIPEREFNDSKFASTQQSESNTFDEGYDDADSSYYEGSLDSYDSAFKGYDVNGYDSYSSDSYSSDSYFSADAEEASDRANQMLENSASQSKTLKEYLTEQLEEVPISEAVSSAATMLISDLDENGFYILMPPKLFEESNFSIEVINEAIKTVQSFDPSGICVENFRQSLILQAKNLGMAESDLEIFTNLVNNELEKINAGKLKAAALSLKIEEEDLASFLAILKTLTPYPGRSYSSDTDSFIVADFSIHNKNGSLTLDINKGDIPELELSPDFCALSQQVKGPEAKETNKWINEKIKDANLLIDQVNLRFKTLSNAALALMELQKDFFLKGPKYLKTMKLKDIADRIGVHETTMSRLAQSKYVETDWGIFQLKYFFSQGVGSTTSPNETVSRNVVKDMIKEIIEQNGALSDQKISDLLKEKGVDCARRTVSKYRKELNINSSYQRN